MLAMTLPGRLGCGAMLMSSHAGEDAVMATWPLKMLSHAGDVATESCWR
jgi:hypothetical protein